jgi:hypothetical protein
MDGNMVVGGPKTVFRNMQVSNPEFGFKKRTKTICKTNFSFPDGFDFGPDQYQTRIVFLFDEIFMIG